MTLESNLEDESTVGMLESYFLIETDGLRWVFFF